MNIKTKPSFWTEERVEELRYYINKTNKSVPEIMKIFGVTRDALRMEVSLLGMKMPKGNRDPRARKFLTSDQVRRMRNEYDNGELTQLELSKKYNLAQSCIYQIIRRKTYRWVED